MALSVISRLSKLFEPAAQAAPSAPVEAVEQRGAPRHEVAIPSRIAINGVETDCEIRNLSSTGMTVTVPGAAICAGQQVVVATERMGDLYGIVRWSRDETHGVQLSRPLSLDALYHGKFCAPEGLQPRPARARVKLQATVRIGSVRRKVEVGNISAGGLMMLSALPFQPGQGLMIDFDDILPLGGHVRWCSGTRSGVMFTKLMPMHAAEELARRCGLGQSWLEEVQAAHDQLAA